MDLQVLVVLTLNGIQLAVCQILRKERAAEETCSVEIGNDWLSTKSNST